MAYMETGSRSFFLSPRSFLHPRICPQYTDRYIYTSGAVDYYIQEASSLTLRRVDRYVWRALLAVGSAFFLFGTSRRNITGALFLFIKPPTPSLLSEKVDFGPLELCVYTRPVAATICARSCLLTGEIYHETTFIRPRKLYVWRTSARRKLRPAFAASRRMCVRVYILRV